MILKNYIIIFFVLVFSLNANAGNRSLPDFVKLVKKYDQAVVNISTVSKGKKVPGLSELNIPELENSPFGDLLKKFFEHGGKETLPEKRKTSSLGSGFVISQDGYILTNNHVVEGADEIIVRMADRGEYSAKLIGTDKKTDIALLKIDAKGLATIKFGKSADLQVGEWVLAIGSPFGFEHTATAGIVSAVGRSLPNENYVPFVQTDVAINPGNSGGPLFNMDGEVIGINSQIYSRTGGFMGLSFAIPIDVALNVVEQLKNKGKVSRGWLGVLIQEITNELAESFGMKKPEGALVAEILKDSPASRSGLRVGDIILEFNGHKIIHSSDLPPIVGQASIDAYSNMKILRNRQIMNLKIKVGELPDDEQVISKSSISKIAPVKSNRLNILLKPVPEEIAKKLPSGNKGVYVAKVLDGVAKDAGIMKGDVILRFNYQEIESVKHFEQMLEEAKANTPIAILVQRESGPVFLAIKIKD